MPGRWEAGGPGQANGQASGSSQPPRMPGPGAELRAVDNALILVAGGAEQHRAGHLAIRTASLEAVRNRRRFVTAGERKSYPVGVDFAVDRTFELLRALMPGDVAVGLFKRETMGARAVHESD